MGVWGRSGQSHRSTIQCTWYLLIIPLRKIIQDVPQKTELFSTIAERASSDKRLWLILILSSLCLYLCYGLFKKNNKSAILLLKHSDACSNCDLLVPRFSKFQGYFADAGYEQSKLGSMECSYLKLRTARVFRRDSPATWSRRSAGSGGESSSMLTRAEGNAVQGRMLL
jgi:hypothetical protein